MTEHPIIPPPELVASLRNSAPHGIRDAGVTREIWLIHNAFAAGADQELEACCEWLEDADLDDSQKVSWVNLRAARRPKPPSPKEEALKVLEALIEWQRIDDPEYQALRHALEQLDD